MCFSVDTPTFLRMEYDTGVTIVFDYEIGVLRSRILSVYPLRSYTFDLKKPDNLSLGFISLLDFYKLGSFFGFGTKGTLGFGV